jgi:hypothetical protein
MINARFNALILFTLKGAGNNNIGVDLSPGTTTLALIYRQEQQHWR